MESAPFFSIIIPVYNRSFEIEKCILSILNQSFLDYEIIVINDGSTDNTADIIEKHKSINFSKIKFISYNKNKGVNFARNRGIESAKGIFLFFLDSDDMLINSLSLRNVKKGIDNNIGYQHYLFTVSDRDNDTTLPLTNYQFEYKDWLTGEASGDFVHVISPACFIGMHFIEEFRAFESLNWLRILKKNKVQFYIPQTIVKLESKRDDSISREYSLNSRKAISITYTFINKYVEWYFDDFLELKIIEKILPVIKKGVLLGIALKENDKNLKLLKILDKYLAKKHWLNYLNIPIFSMPVLGSIIVKSFYNKKR